LRKEDITNCSKNKQEAETSDLHACEMFEASVDLP
jgi:hypothetical protein